jgi:two-component system response regulator MprA
MRILVVDDDRAVREALRRALTLGGYEVQLAEDGELALELIAQSMPDAVLLDLGLPGLDGLEVCRRIRRLGNRVPILIVTARDAVADRIDGLDVGEMKARVRALLRRAAPDLDASRLSFAEVTLDPARHGAQVGEKFVELTRTEYQLLELLMINPRHVLSHSLIYDRVWGYDFGPASNALRVYVGYLRRKLEDAGARQLIHTVRGVGYALREP